MEMRCDGVPDGSVEAVVVAEVEVATTEAAVMLAGDFEGGNRAC